MFTDVNHTGSVGVSVKGEAWHRPDDTIGVAAVISGISHDNQLYLAAGGLGILDGDGALNYAKEKVLEAYYDGKLASTCTAHWTTSLLPTPRSIVLVAQSLFSECDCTSSSSAGKP
jgi:high affinity Mn2+ porin